jgi:hypothetical protein
LKITPQTTPNTSPDTTPNTTSASTQAAKQRVISELAVLARDLLPWLLLEETSSCSSASSESPYSCESPEFLLARELYRFLTIKRDHPDANVSPGPLVDQLWHSLLLETDLAAAVHSSLGVETVRHSLRDSARLTHADKIQHRLNALEHFSQRGWVPQLDFWFEPGAEIVSVAAGGGGRGDGKSSARPAMYVLAAAPAAAVSIPKKSTTTTPSKDVDKTLFIESWFTSKTIMLEPVEPSNTIARVKQMIGRKSAGCRRAFEADRAYLEYGGRPLDDDDCTLSGSGVFMGSTLSFVIAGYDRGLC